MPKETCAALWRSVRREINHSSILLFITMVYQRSSRMASLEPAVYSSVKEAMTIIGMINDFLLDNIFKSLFYSFKYKLLSSPVTNSTLSFKVYLLKCKIPD